MSALITNKKAIMHLFSDALEPRSHQVRFVMAEKAIQVEIIYLDPDELPPELGEYNPYLTLPTIVDRDLSIFSVDIIMEYLDERFPHPPLMPVYPVSRAEVRRNIYQINQDLYLHYDKMVAATQVKQREQHKARLIENLLAISPLFKKLPFFLSEELTLSDCCLAPLLWRLPALDIELPKQAILLTEYANRLFERPSFQASLTEQEMELR